MTFLLPAAAAVVVLYALLAAGCRLVLARTPPPPPAPDPWPTVAVVVAARDEESHLPACLEALRRQDYPAGRLEIVVVDDASTDATAALLDAAVREDMRQADPRLKAVHLEPAPPGSPLTGKARALHEGIRRSEGALLVMTDADCRPPPTWVRSLATRLDERTVGMVCGVTLVEHGRLLDRIQALDWLLLLAVSSGAAEAGRPLTAMGNNMAVRRRAYEAVGGFPALPASVTEDYALFQAVGARPEWRVGLHLAPDLVNRTAPLPSLAGVFSQRRRWARGGLRARPVVYVFYAFVFLAHLAPFLALAASPASGALLFGLKVAADLMLLHFARRRLGADVPLRSLIVYEAYLFAYVLLLPFALLLAPRINWKGRRY